MIDLIQWGKRSYQGKNINCEEVKVAAWDLVGFAPSLRVLSLGSCLLCAPVGTRFLTALATYRTDF